MDSFTAGNVFDGLDCFRRKWLLRKAEPDVLTSRSGKCAGDLFFPKSISDALGSRLVYFPARGARQKSRTSKAGRKDGRKEEGRKEGGNEKRKEGSVEIA